MAANDVPNRKGQAFAAAVYRFPQSELAIRRLMSKSEDFCDVCADLADAERALAAVPKLTEALFEARRREWQEMIDNLVSEVADALEGSEGDRSGARG